MIRRATPEDSVAIAHIEQLAAHSPWTETMAVSTLQQATTHAWVSEMDGQVVAHLLTTVAADTAEVLIVATAPSHRRRGIARRLLIDAEAAWKAVGVVEAFLEVRADNEGAIALYKALDWTQVGKRPRYYKDGTDAVLMKREL